MKFGRNVLHNIISHRKVQPPGECTCSISQTLRNVGEFLVYSTFILFTDSLLNVTHTQWLVLLLSLHSVLSASEVPFELAVILSCREYWRIERLCSSVSIHRQRLPSTDCNQTANKRACHHNLPTQTNKSGYWTFVSTTDLIQLFILLFL